MDDLSPVGSQHAQDVRPHDELFRSLREVDRQPARNAILLERSPPPPDVSPIDKACFIDRAYHDAEKEKLWARVWQMACFEQDIPNVGDYIEYVIADQSILVVRKAADEIRAFHNVCQHRGMRLKTGTGCSREIRCPFHGWTWGLDGALQNVPFKWDFPTVSNETHRLAEVRVEIWNGFVFVNFDKDAGSLEDFLGETILRHFKQWPLERRWKSLHVSRVFPCNWKLALSAFMEIYHVEQTHSSWQSFVGDELTQFDNYGLHSRWITPFCVTSPSMGVPLDEQEIIDAMNKDMFSDMFGNKEFPAIKVADGQTARERMADHRRGEMVASAGQQWAELSDSELLDPAEYWIFPNLAIFPSGVGPIIYRSRPDGDQHESSIFEMMVLMPVDETKPQPKAVPTRIVGPDESYFDIPELSTTAKTLTEDTDNLASIQLAHHSAGFFGPTFARYQESGIRQFHLNLDRWLARD